MKKGYTLLEALITLSLFMVLSFSLLFLWQYAARGAQNAIRMQNVLDNLGIAMDGLIINIQHSYKLVLNTDSQDVLRRLEMHGYDPNGNPHTYIFTFNPNALPAQAIYRRLFFGGQEYAYGIRTIQIINVGYMRLDITITSICAHPVVFAGSVDIRHKHVVIQ